MRRLPALEKQRVYLEGQLEKVRQAQDRSEKRFEEKLITLPDINQIRIKASSIERRLLQIQAEMAYLVERNYTTPKIPLTELKGRYDFVPTWTTFDEAVPALEENYGIKLTQGDRAIDVLHIMPREAD